jgi:hypothetical protein
MPKVTIEFATLAAQYAITTRLDGPSNREQQSSRSLYMNDKLEAAKRFLGNRYVLRKDYKPVERHRLSHRVNTLETIREARERIRQSLT